MKKKGKKIRSIARRLMRRIGLAQLIVMGLASWLIYSLTKSIVSEEEISLYQANLRVTNQGVSKVLSNVKVSTSNRVDEIVDHLGTPDQLCDIMRRIVENNPRVRSCGLSFIDSYYPEKGRWFCPYAVRPDSGAVETSIIGSASHDYLNAQWFKEALAADSAYWSKPFFDATDSVTPLSAYMIPIHDKRGKTVAILGADLKLDFFSGVEVDGLSINGEDIKFYIGDDNLTDDSRSDDSNDNNGNGKKVKWKSNENWRLAEYCFVIDSDGTFIAHPDKHHVINENYFTLAKETADTIDDYVGRQMVLGKEGSYTNSENAEQYIEFFDMKGASAYIFYQPVAHTSWSIALAVPRIQIDAYAIGIGAFLLMLMGLGLLAGRIVGRAVIKRTMRPLSTLADSANEVARGNFSAPLPLIKHNDEIKLLRDSFEVMQHSLTDYVEELKSTTASKAAIENELKVAHDIQMSMLPKKFPPYPERHDIDIYGLLKPAKDVGGDLFDFYIRDEQLFFCIGDVSGKGVPASLLMAVTRSLFRNISAHVAAPNLIVETLNKALADGNETSMFVTVFVGALDLATGHLYYCNAGHDAPLLITSDDVQMMPCDPNLPLGVMDDWSFTLQETTLVPEATIFLYTDGLNEAEDAAHKQFGMERIIAVLRAAATVSPAATVSSLCSSNAAALIGKMTDAVHAFVGEAEQSDDLTMLAIKYEGKGEKS